MLIPKPEDALHKAMLYRILTAIADDLELSKLLMFKGGTCAAMMGYLNRFSVDLDFDYIGDVEKANDVRQKMMVLVKDSSFEVKDYSKSGIQFFLKYQSSPNKRNTLKIDTSFPVSSHNVYKTVKFSDLDRTLTCQSIETMFANKLIALKERFEKSGSVAGRDLYDIHSFFVQGLTFNESIILESLHGQGLKDFFEALAIFVKKHFTETVLSQDLNMLLTEVEFKKIRKIIVPETIVFLSNLV